MPLGCPNHGSTTVDANEWLRWVSLSTVSSEVICDEVLVVIGTLMPHFSRGVKDGWEDEASAPKGLMRSHLDI